MCLSSLPDFLPLDRALALRWLRRFLAGVKQDKRCVTQTQQSSPRPMFSAVSPTHTPWPNRQVLRNTRDLLLWLFIKWWHKGLTKDFLETHLIFFHSWQLLKSHLLCLIHVAPSQAGGPAFAFVFPRDKPTHGTGPQDMSSVLTRIIYPWSMVNKNLHLIMSLGPHTRQIFNKYCLEVLFPCYSFWIFILRESTGISARFHPEYQLNPWSWLGCLIIECPYFIYSDLA